jgi:hypothetical protein
MLTRQCLWSMVSSAIFCCCCEASAHADQAQTPVVLLIDPAQDHDDYSYRKTNEDKTVSVMLFGFRDQPDTPIIAKGRQSLGSFFKEHLDRIKDDYFSHDPESLHLVTGENDFDSTEINRGIGLEPAKMAGFTAPYGHWTLGSGYTWGEKNPALMRRTKANGLFTGLSYDAGNTGYQLSYLKSGKTAGFNLGGSSIDYNSLMLGTSFRVTDRMGLAATIQYRTDEDPLTTGDRQVIFTVGTKWKF